MAITDICCDHHHGHQDTVFTIKVPGEFKVAQAQASTDAAVKKLVQCAQKRFPVNPGPYWGDQAQICDKKWLGPRGITLKCMQKQMASKNKLLLPDCDKEYLRSPDFVDTNMFDCGRCRYMKGQINSTLNRFANNCPHPQDPKPCVIDKLLKDILTPKCQTTCAKLQTSGIPDHIISGFIPLRSTRSQLIDFL
jgi:hypothetical protein